MIKEKCRLLYSLSSRVQRLYASLNIPGLVLALVFFAASLTPSLLPRPFFIQGLVSGLSVTSGYFFGVCLWGVWTYLHFPSVKPFWVKKITHLFLGLGIALVIHSLWRTSVWQKKLLEFMGVDTTTSVNPIALTLIALGIFMLLLLVARGLAWIFRKLLGFMSPYLSMRIATLVASVSVIIFAWTLFNGVLIRSILSVTDRSFQQLDALIEDNIPQPQSAMKVGSDVSLLDWEGLGRQGRRFVAGSTDLKSLQDFWSAEYSAASAASAASVAPIKEPIRVYVGLNSAHDKQERARLALQELIRVGGFEREVLVLITPTGTGWIDAQATETLEYLLRGNVASVAMQYSYLSSPLALLTESDYGTESAQILFNLIYSYWRDLPVEQRPKLFLYGLSLGALYSDRSFELFDIIDDPFDGVLWVGPPYSHETWQHVTLLRDEGSPSWLPRFREGSIVRFANQQSSLNQSLYNWRNFRMGFLQYGSDPIVFFNPQIAWREPQWMSGARAFDVSEEFQWFPVVTMLQLLADMVVGTAPKGFGHQYAPIDYLESWKAIIAPDTVSSQDYLRLKAHFKQTGGELFYRVEHNP